MNRFRLVFALRIALTLSLTCALLVAAAVPGLAQGGLDHVTISPSNPIVTSGGSTQTFTATGYDASNNPISGLAFAWSVTNAQAGSIDASTGVFTAGGIGGEFIDVIQAASEGIIGKGSVTVAGPLHHIAVIPSSVTVARGGTQTFTAQGYDLYNTLRTGDVFVWSVNDPQAGAIDPSTGVFTAGTEGGTYSVTASSGGVTGSASVTIPPEPLPVFYQNFPEMGGDLAFGPSGNLYTSSGNKYDSNGQWLLSWPGGGEIAVNSSENVYVVSGGGVSKYSSNGELLLHWGSLGGADGQFFNPHGIGVDSQGNVYVADTGNNRIQKFDGNGNFLLKWGSLGSGNGQFGSPGGPFALAVNSADEVYVSDNYDARILKFSSQGQYLSQWSLLQGGANSFDPTDMTVDSAGYVYISSNLINDYSVRKFSPSGLYKWTLGGGYHGWTFYLPYSVAVDVSGKIWIANMTGFGVSGVKVYGPPPPSLHHITISPANPLLGQGAHLTFTAKGYDSSNNVIPGIGFIWSSNNSSGGSINSMTGAFVAGDPSVYNNLVQAATGTVTGTASVTIVAHTPLKGDINADGAVDIADLVAVAAVYGSSPPSNPDADVNADGKVDIFDLAILGLNYGSSLSG